MHTFILWVVNVIIIIIIQPSTKIAVKSDVKNQVLGKYEVINKKQPNRAPYSLDT